MSVPQRIICVFAFKISTASTNLRSFILFNNRSSLSAFLPVTQALRLSSSVSNSPMPNYKKKAGKREGVWKEMQSGGLSSSMEATPAPAEAIADRLSGLSMVENAGQTSVPVSSIRFGSVPLANQTPVKSQKTIWKPKNYGTVSGAPAVEVETPVPHQSSTAPEIQMQGAETAPTKNSSVGLSKILKGPLGADFNVDNFTYSLAQIRATFYPKFENEKSDQEVRTRMIETVSHGLATVEVSLKHSGSLFMYAGHEGGAYAKNSFGNVYTAVGVFVLGRMFCEAWGTEATKKQSEFNDFLERNHMCISMELVTAVLGDHGQRPREDYVVVTAVTELGDGKPKFYSTPDIIAFCRKWRLPTNHVWLFSTRKSVTSFFAAYDALCEEGTATTVCKALDEVADISVPGSKDHIQVQGEILEGLVARIVSPDSLKHMEKALADFRTPPLDGDGLNFGASLREICAANRSDEKQQIKALLQSVGPSFCPNGCDWFGNGDGDAHSRNADRSVLSKFLQAHPADFSTTKLQEMIRLMREKRFPAAFKCYYNFHKLDSLASDNLHFKMVIHVHSDSAFRRYQKEMRNKPGLWPLYRGFFVDINLYKVNKDKASEISKGSNVQEKSVNGTSCGKTTSGADGLADEDANLMIKLKFLTYKLRTFLIRNGLSILFKEGPAAYKAYYLRQMKIWGTSAGKQRELSKMLDEWAVYIRRKYGNNQLSSSIYLSEAEPFLEQFAKRSPENQALIGAAGNLVRAEDFLAIVEGDRDEEGDLEVERDIAPSSPSPTVKDTVPKAEGLIVFFPGIPGCAKSALCKEILSATDGLGDDRPVNSLMGDLIKGRYWPKVAEERRKKPYAITLADKNAPNEEVWRQIEDMCRSTRASAVPVVPDSEGTHSNPFSLDALAVFMFRVLQRVNHPGNLDKASPNAGYVLLMFYNLYEGKDRREFESELNERFGALVKMPLLKTDMSPLPDPVKSILEEGLSLYRLHTKRHGRLESSKGSYAKEWAIWEKKLREILFGNAEYLNSIQVPFDYAVKQVLEQLKTVAKGDFSVPNTEKRKFGTIAFAAVTLPVTEIRNLLNNLAVKNPKVEAFLKGKDMENSLKKAHVTLAHKRSHGVTAVASYGMYLHREVPVDFTALLFSDNLAALEAHPGSVDGEKITSKNQWPHVTIWTGGLAAKEANTLPQLLSEGKATRIEINPPVTIPGSLDFY
ncbi:tRNA ligase 1 isoform X2 [Telopea speciosissima]|uniref:tRNA ligase 1 isoform X2 n=1 Tax=Telopea speciosissima TaxID=54955 RepID=UPI001CC606D6|nr:tRNA ligase 1 isoform X2 [Telopea speciosissima]